ncbi:hypothetical protein [Micromonospora pisi]|nr:hypothetical protein [Micromonospora pisi]
MGQQILVFSSLGPLRRFVTRTSYDFSAVFPGFAEFRDRIAHVWPEWSGELAEEELDRLDLRSVLDAIVIGEAHVSPYAGNVFDCLNLLYDLSVQFPTVEGLASAADTGALKDLYRVIWGEVDPQVLDYAECERQFRLALELVEGLVRWVDPKETDLIG